MARLKVWRDVGFFDPTYFLYYEEVDLMLQIAARAWECWYVPEAKVIHHEGAATGVRSGEQRRASGGLVYLYDSWRHYFSKNHGRAYALTGAVLWLVGGTVGLGIARCGAAPPGAAELRGRHLALCHRPLLRPGGR
jgi:N-acetylglucosaminyl-diphospho-decaprenol L-rhamnosyltransferase